MQEWHFKSNVYSFGLLTILETITDSLMMAFGYLRRVRFLLGSSGTISKAASGTESRTCFPGRFRVGGGTTSTSTSVPGALVRLERLLPPVPSMCVGAVEELASTEGADCSGGIPGAFPGGCVTAVVGSVESVCSCVGVAPRAMLSTVAGVWSCLEAGASPFGVKEGRAFPMR